MISKSSEILGERCLPLYSSNKKVVKRNDSEEKNQFTVKRLIFYDTNGGYLGTDHFNRKVMGEEGNFRAAGIFFQALA